MAYTKEQKERMVKKVMEMKRGDIFMLNKHDVCPIKCKMMKNRFGIAFESVETGKYIVCAPGRADWEGTAKIFVDRVEKTIDNWDLVTKQHFIDLARK